MTNQSPEPIAGLGSWGNGWIRCDALCEVRAHRNGRERRVRLANSCFAIRLLTETGAAVRKFAPGSFRWGLRAVGGDERVRALRRES